MARYVWLFGVEVEALAGHEMVKPGMGAQLQVCVPGRSFEQCLDHLDRYLVTERCRRVDLWLAKRFDLDNESEEYPSEYLKRDLREAGEREKPVTACIVICENDLSVEPDEVN